MQPLDAISENVSLKDLQSSNSREYKLLTALIFTSAGSEYMYTCTHVGGWRMRAYEHAVCMCRCAQLELRVK